MAAEIASADVLKGYWSGLPLVSKKAEVEKRLSDIQNKDITADLPS